VNEASTPVRRASGSSQWAGGSRKRGGATRAARPTSALGVISVLLGLLVLTVGTISSAFAGAWAALVTLLPIGLSLVLVPRRDGRQARGS
jgi:hypothetical protein